MVGPTPIVKRRRRLRAPATALVVALVVVAVIYRGELGAWIAGDRGAPASSAAAVAFYTCSMDPSVEAAHPGSCPICGMALTAVTQEDRTSGVVRIAADARERIGLRVAPVEIKPLRQRVVAFGEVVGPAPAPAEVAGRASVVAQMYRDSVDDLRPGHAITATVPELPLTQFTGAIVAPRTGDAPGALRVMVDNPDQVLRPGTYVEIQIDRELPPRLVVPAQAVLYAGARRIVFVDRGSGRFEPRTPKLGSRDAGFVEVLEGLAAGDQVVVEGMFLLAAESRIRSDGALWSDRTEPAPARRPTSGPGRSDRP